MPLFFLLGVVLIKFILSDPRNAFLFFDDLLNEIVFSLLLLNFEIYLFIYLLRVLFVLRIDLILPWSWDMLYSFLKLIDKRFLLLGLDCKGFC